MCNTETYKAEYQCFFVFLFRFCLFFFLLKVSNRYETD